jgi:hypothetical protein
VGSVAYSVTLGGADISARLTGTLRVERNRGVAGVATLYYRAAGAVSEADIEGLAVVISGAVDCALYTVSSSPLFSGRVTTARRSLDRGVWYLLCTDSLREQANAADLATLRGWLGETGYWSRRLFGERSTGYRQLQDLAGTTYGTVQCSASDVPGWTSWDPAALTTLTLSDCLGTPEEQSADLSGLVNRVNLTLDWTHPRVWRREITVGWNWAAGLGGGDPWRDFVAPADGGVQGRRYWQNPWPLPTPAEVYAIDGAAGWSLLLGNTVSGVGFAAQYIPQTGWYDVSYIGGGEQISSRAGLSALTGDSLVWRPTGSLASALKQFSVDMERRGSQDVTRRYVITLQATDSVNRFGGRELTETLQLGEDHDTSAYEAAQGSADRSVRYQREDGTTVSVSVTASYQDLVDTEAEAEALLAAIRSRAYHILAGHRRQLRVRVPLAPQIGHGHAIALDGAAGVTVSALPVQCVLHEIVFPASANGGRLSAVTTLTLARSYCATPTVSSSDLDAPAAPDTGWTHSQSHPSSFSLTNYIGGNAGVPDWDEATMDQGWIANRVRDIGEVVEEGDPTEYPVQGWRFQLPDIEDEMTDPHSGETSETLTIAVPHAPLTIAGFGGGGGGGAAGCDRALQTGEDVEAAICTGVAPGGLLVYLLPDTPWPDAELRLESAPSGASGQVLRLGCESDGWVGYALYLPALSYPSTGSISIRFRFESTAPGDSLTVQALCYGSPQPSGAPVQTFGSSADWQTYAGATALCSSHALSLSRSGTGAAELLIDSIHIEVD